MEAGLRKRRKFPEDHWYFNEPEVPAGCGFLMEAFRDLVTCRAPEGPIPWTAAALYADKAGLDPDTAEVMWTAVRAMDEAERAWAAADIAGAGSDDA